MPLYMPLSFCRPLLAALFFVFCVLPWPDAKAQALPETEIYVCRVKQKKGQWQISSPQNITRRPGYDNQPAFTPDGRQILFTSIRERPAPDIYAYNLKKKEVTPVTNSPEGEYSPTIMPHKKSIAVVRGEEQQIWELPLTSAQPPSVLFSNARKVGYFTWLTPDSLAVFMLGEPHTLHLATVDNYLSAPLAANIGRSLHKVPGRATLSFVSKASAPDWEIKALDWRTGQVSTLTKTLPGSEDFIWTADGQIIMAQGPRLYLFNPQQPAGGWTPIADFSGTGLKNITRLALDAKEKRLAFVGVM